MRRSTTKPFDREFKKFSREIQNAFEKQINLLLQDIRHPSLRAKKYDEGVDIWQARVTKNVRFYFRFKGDVCILLNIRKHKD
jgi:mRNA-degrading endonuclease RelE of RelBE toxin-antitoxin system